MKIKIVDKFKEMDKGERRVYLRELLINNSLYIFLIAAIILIQCVNPRFLSFPSIINIISLSAANLPIALGIAGAIILTGTDLSAGRIVGRPQGGYRHVTYLKWGTGVGEDELLHLLGQILCRRAVGIDRQMIAAAERRR